MHLVNLTPHVVTLLLGPNNKIELPPSGVVPRLILKSGPTQDITVNGVLVQITVGSVLVGVEPALPEPEPDTIYVTSRVVAEHHPHRHDLVWPDDLVRDEEGRVIGARRLASTVNVEA